MPFAGPIVMGIDANPDSLTSTAPTSSLFSAAWEFVKRIVGIVVLVCGARLTKEIHQTCVSQSVLMAMTTRLTFVSELILLRQADNKTYEVLLPSIPPQYAHRQLQASAKFLVMLHPRACRLRGWHWHCLGGVECLHTGRGDVQRT